MKKLLLLTLALLVAFGVSVPRASADVTVYVGYADNLRPSPNFPIGFGAGASLDGISPGGVTQFFTGAGAFDSGAILIVNTGASFITLDAVSATIPTWTTNPLGGTSVSTAAGSLWAAFSSITLAPGNGAIFTQTGQFNFDTSDIGLQSPLLNQTMNCDMNNAFAIANPLVCAGIAPTVTVTIGGVPKTLIDTGQVLDTGGFDTAFASTLCPGGPVSPGGFCNESLQWRLIGTSGIGNPGGFTPEPASLLLMGSGLFGLAGLVRKKIRA